MISINNLDDLSLKIGISKQTLFKLSRKSELLYKNQSIPKKNGKSRILNCPNIELKSIQLWILREILEMTEVHEKSFGFKKGSSILDNAKVHIGNNYSLNIDIKNFFGSLKRPHVFNLFISMGYNRLVAITLTNITTYQNKLPQGAPTSPYISNLILKHFDQTIDDICKNNDLVYSRYCDDITISGNDKNKILDVYEILVKKLAEFDLSINPTKYRLNTPYSGIIITGLRLTKSKVQITKKLKREFRAKIFNFMCSNEYSVHKLNNILGMLCYLKSVDFSNLKYFTSYINEVSKKTNTKNSFLLTNNKIFVKLKKSTKD